MVPTKILRNFQGARATDAMDAGFEFAVRTMNWPVNDRAHMYQMSDLAFGPSPDFESFSRIYNELVRYWKIGRNGELASATEVFRMLVNGCGETSRQSGNTLLNVDVVAIRNAVRAMRRVKANGEYPHMPASKFLHFYNPSLFPIYDNAVLWERVLHGVFLPEWKGVCREYRINVTEQSDRFLITYFSWAAEVMRSADPEVMIDFERRFRGRWR